MAPFEGELSAAARAVIDTGLATLTYGPTHLLTLTFDGNRSKRQTDFRPELPLVVKW